MGDIFTPDYREWAQSQPLQENDMSSFDNQLQAEDFYVDADFDSEGLWERADVCVVCGEDCPYEDYICRSCALKIQAVEDYLTKIDLDSEEEIFGQTPYCFDCNKPLIDKDGEVCVCPDPGVEE